MTSVKTKPKYASQPKKPKPNKTAPQSNKHDFFRKMTRSGQMSNAGLGPAWWSIFHPNSRLCLSLGPASPWIQNHHSQKTRKMPPYHRTFTLCLGGIAYCNLYFIIYDSLNDCTCSTRPMKRHEIRTTGLKNKATQDAKLGSHATIWLNCSNIYIY
jgi:hypothetical protein